MVDSEKLSLCCSDVGRYLLLGEEGGRRVEGGEDISQEIHKKRGRRSRRKRGDGRVAVREERKE